MLFGCLILMFLLGGILLSLIHISNSILVIYHIVAMNIIVLLF
ncbi:Uncharacterised protein [Staphylococcus intermedius NCTC 11048]|uniref:Uncharacterized protein n=1 Tax=Staphylococcus intermedius NCTC 11048 TaxID=1141106 RepID=A0A380G6X8_STAIN|nr:Uncharacterised protein [Staphylococcus intermedius NCTC 11048]